jgi:hypothetical protein
MTFWKKVFGVSGGKDDTVSTSASADAELPPVSSVVGGVLLCRIHDIPAKRGRRN